MLLVSLAAVTLLVSLLISSSLAVPFPTQTSPAQKRGLGWALAPAVERDYEVGDVPYFPTDIQACVVCQPRWSGINTCARAAPAFKSVTEILGDPASFISEIKCACTDTFQSAYPQCVSCFVQTNQCQQYLGVPSEAGAGSIIDGMRQVCGFGSALLGGGVATAVNASYTYSGEPSQGYPTTTSYGPGGLDLGSAEGKRSGAQRTELGHWIVLGLGVMITLHLQSL